MSADNCIECGLIGQAACPEHGGTSDYAEFELHCDGTPVGGASGPRAQAWKEIVHYLSMYRQDGECEVFEVTRRKVCLDALAAPSQPAEIPGTYTVDGAVMSPLEYIDYLHGQLAANKAQPAEPVEQAARQENCGNCHKCMGAGWIPNRMLLCPDCGNKRCPKASDHALACTGSNEANQPGSIYGGVPSHPAAEQAADEGEREAAFAAWWNRPGRPEQSPVMLSESYRAAWESTFNAGWNAAARRPVRELTDAGLLEVALSRADFVGKVSLVNMGDDLKPTVTFVGREFARALLSKATGEKS